MLPRDHDVPGHPHRLGPLLPIVIVLAVIVALHVVGAIFLLTGGFGALVPWHPIFYAAIGLIIVIGVFHVRGFWRSR